MRRKRVFIENGRGHIDLANEYYEYLRNIFGVDVGSIKVVVCKNEKDFENKIGHSVPVFIVGFAVDLEKILIIAKNQFRVRGHEPSEFDGVLLHEIAHIFFRRIVKRPVFPWIEEGFCEHISFHDKHAKNEIFIDLTKIRTAKDWYKRSPYTQSKNFVGFLIKKFTLSKFIEFIKLLCKKEEEVAFKSIFKKTIS